MPPDPTPTPDAAAKRVFGEALDLEGSKRAAYLDGACAGDAILRARVERLLLAAEQPDRFLSEPQTREIAAAGGEQAGSMIGRYKIVRALGEGGFGTVFLAEQQHPIRREVALKVIKLGMDTKAVIARFEHERQALAVMDHPNIARVLDAGATATGRPYFVMELVAGEPITAYCDRAKLPIPERLELFAQVCAAVQHAHTKGVIHRDLKPGNVLVAEHDGTPTAKVIDVGIAKATNRSAAEHAAFTEQRQLVGTPEYMSPEQASGSGDIDTRTDIYSLGVVLYELLTGAPPFDPRVLRSGAYAEIQRIIREVEPPRPSTRVLTADVAARRSTEPRRLESLVRGELDWIVMRALEKEPGRRYASPGELAADVRRHLTGRPVVAAPPGAGYRIGKFVKRHRGVVAAGAAVVLALAVGTVGTVVGLVRAREAAQRATEQAQLARAQSARADREAADARGSAAAADSVDELISAMITRADRGREGGRTNVTVREVMDAGARELADNPGAHEPRVAARLARTIGETYRCLSIYDAAERMMRQHAELQEKREPGGLAHAAAIVDLGALLKAQGRHDDAADLYARARAMMEKLGDEALPRRAQLANNEAALAVALGRHAEAEALLRATVAELETQGLTGEEAYPNSLSNLAAVMFETGKTDEAEALYRKSLDARPVGTGLSAERLDVLHNLAGLAFRRGDIEAAVRASAEVVDGARALYGPDHLRLAEALRQYAIAVQRAGDLAAAEAAVREALTIQRALLPANSPTVGGAVSSLGVVLQAREDFAGAEAVYAEAMTILGPAQGPGHWETVFMSNRLAALRLRRGALDEAERVLRESMAQTHESLSPGARYEWMGHAAASLLGEVQLRRAEAPGLDGAAREALFVQAEALITPAADTLVTLAAKMGPVTRKETVGAALDRAVALYEAWHKAAPSPERETATAAWRAKREAFKT